MTCAEVEVLLCGYLDGTLSASEKEAVDRHLTECSACAGFAQDVSAATGFLARVPQVEPPAELVTRILFQIPSRQNVESSGGLRKLFARWLEPVLQPRFAMGMAMTILSFAMIGRSAGIQVRQLRVADLNPTKVWQAADDRIHRAWERAVKYYDNMRLVYEVRSRLLEWTQQEDEARKARADRELKEQTRPEAPSGRQGSEQP